MEIVNSKIVILAVVGIIILIIGITVINYQESKTIKVGDSFDEKLEPKDGENAEIQEKLDEIEKNKLENEYKPKPRDWVTSGPFQIDRSEYVLGEKIFLRTDGLHNQEKGEIVFHRPVKSIDNSIYLTIPFDGEKRTEFNYYLEPQLSVTNGFCTADDFIGDWTVVFRGTNYESIEFKITKDILTGEEEDYQPVC